MHNTMFKCCVPSNCYLKPLDSLSDNVVKIVCSNLECQEGCFMHNYCFNHWQNNILQYFVLITKIGNWSDKQKEQYIWTNKGYEIIYKVCRCKCAKGYLKPYAASNQCIVDKNAYGNEIEKKSIADMYITNNDNDCKNVYKYNGRHRTISKSSNSSLSIITSPSPLSFIPSSFSFSDDTENINHSVTKDNLMLKIPSAKYKNCIQTQLDVDHLSQESNISTSVYSSNPDIMNFNHSMNLEKCIGCIFPVRTDYSVFNCLPRSLINSYHIKMDDEGPHGNDEIRYTLLSHLSSLKVTSLSCLYCFRQLSIYDRYPLMDGTMFLSPINHMDASNNVLAHQGINQVSSEGIRFKMDNPLHHHKEKDELYQSQLPYLNAVCMHCLTGAKLFNLLKKIFDKLNTNLDKSNGDMVENLCKDYMLQSIPKLNIIVCKYCNKPWDGSNYTIGTLYFYDILSATSCCQSRRTCKKCGANLEQNFGLQMNQNEKYVSQFLNGNLYNNDYSSPYNTLCKLNKPTINQLFNIPLDVTNSNNYYSQNSQTSVCPNCNNVNYHFVKEKSYGLIKITVQDNFLKCN